MAVACVSICTLNCGVETQEPTEVLDEAVVSSAWKFDFGPGPVQSGFTQVLSTTAYTAARGYGFTSTAGLTAHDRGLPDALRRDFIHHPTNFEFKADTGNGRFAVAVTLGDYLAGQDSMNVSAEGTQVLTNFTSAPNQFPRHTFIVQVTDGQLNLAFSGTHPRIVALEISTGGFNIVQTGTPTSGTITADNGRVRLVFDKTNRRIVELRSNRTGLWSGNLLNTASGSQGMYNQVYVKNASGKAVVVNWDNTAATEITQNSNGRLEIRVMGKFREAGAGPLVNMWDSARMFIVLYDGVNPEGSMDGFYMYGFLRHLESVMEDANLEQYSFATAEVVHAQSDYYYLDDAHQGPIGGYFGEYASEGTPSERKYHYAIGMADRQLYGLCKNSGPGYGLFVVTPNHAFRDIKGPDSVWLPLHESQWSPGTYNYLLTTMDGSHFKSPEQRLRVPAGARFSKVFGPVFYYLNYTTGSAATRVSDAKARVQLESARDYKKVMNAAYQDYYAKKATRVTGKLYLGSATAGNELRNQRVWVNHNVYQTRTDASGQFEILWMPPGTHALNISVPGKTDFTYAFTVSQAETDLGSKSLGNIVVPWHKLPQIWSIGTPDYSYAEFRLSRPYSDQFGNYLTGAMSLTPPAPPGIGTWQDYASVFPKDCTFNVGVSTPATSWNWVQPGDADAWGGQVAHPWKVTFPVSTAPTNAGSIYLVMSVTGSGTTPRMAAEVNGTRLPDSRPLHASRILGFYQPLGQEDVVVTSFDRRLLRAGTNQIRLWPVGGRAVLWDSVALYGNVTSP